VGEGETEGESEKRYEEGAMAEEALGSQACLCQGDDRRTDRRTVRPWTALPEKFKKIPKTFSQVLFPGDNQRPGPKPRALAFLRSSLQVTTNHPDQKAKAFS